MLNRCHVGYWWLFLSVFDKILHRQFKPVIESLQNVDVLLLIDKSHLPQYTKLFAHVFLVQRGMERYRFLGMIVVLWPLVICRSHPESALKRRLNRQFLSLGFGGRICRGRGSQAEAKQFPFFRR